MGTRKAQTGIVLTEAQIEHQILDYLSKQPNTFSFKNHTRGFYDPVLKRFRPLSRWTIKGNLDVIICHRGVYASWEIKTTTGRLSEDQRHVMDRIVSAGGIAKVIRSLDDAILGFNELKEYATILHTN